MIHKLCEIGHHPQESLQRSESAWIFSGSGLWPEKWVDDPWTSDLTVAVSLWHNLASGSKGCIFREKHREDFRDNCLLDGHYYQIRISGSHLLSLPDPPPTRAWCVVKLQAPKTCQMASYSIGTAQMLYWTWFCNLTQCQDVCARNHLYLLVKGRSRLPPLRASGNALNGWLCWNREDQSICVTFWVLQGQTTTADHMTRIQESCGQQLL